LKYLKISSDLYLIQEEVVKKKEVEEVGRTNHLWIFDRSGSMYYTLPQLCQDLITRAKQLPVGDTITLGWFSSEGKFNFILKGFKISDDSDYIILENAINKNNYTIGLTCFSEILAATKQVVEDLKIFSDRFALCFFTDGHPVTGNNTKEVASIFQAIKEVENSISASLLIGYGNYYNKSLMSQMAEAFGGTLTHSSDLARFNITLVDFIQNVKGTDNKIKVLMPCIKDDIFFSINGSNINVYKQDDQYVNFIPYRGSKNYIFRVTSKLNLSAKDKEIEFTSSNINGNTIESTVRGAYAAAYILTQQAKTDKALKVLGTLGDKALIDVVANSFTNDEYGKAERRINEAVIAKKKRFINGRNTDYLPKDDAFCLLDAIELLLKDKKAYFHSQDKRFVYTRVGVPSVVKEGYPTFKADKDVKCPFSSINWNKTKLNLSVLARITGSIKLDKNWRTLSFKKATYPTWIYRNYTLVKDGFLNVQVLPLSMNSTSFKKLQEKGLIDDRETWKEDKVYAVELTHIPIMNRVIANGKTSAKEMFEKTFRAFVAQATLKVMKAKRDEIDPEAKYKAVGAFEGMKENQIFYLADLGITKNGFSPPTEKLESTDYYFAKEFDIKMAKLSSLPKVSDVETKITAGKNLTLRERIVKDCINFYNQNIPVTASVDIVKQELNDYIKRLQDEIVTLRSDIQKTKFAIVLGNKWFDEFSSRENNTMTLGEITFSISLTEKKIEI